MEKKRLIVWFIVCSLALSALFLPGYTKLRELKAERARYQQRIAILEEYNRALQEEIERMREDPDYLEKKARDKLGIVRKGEVVYRKDGE
ncbi:MAG TPA: septum formation initiator family protein [Candidatus Omnitrophota bacterium]|nr:septum formation initiator family protein [Candidatus Omnitrophota bacterium]